MSDAIKLAIEALGGLIESVTGVDQVSAVNQARTALAALRAQPADPFKKLSDAQVLWLAESHGIDVYACNTLAFYNDLIGTTAMADPLAVPDYVGMCVAGASPVEPSESVEHRDELAKRKPEPAAETVGGLAKAVKAARGGDAPPAPMRRFA